MDKNNIKTVYADMPNGIGGYTVKHDEEYTIVLNSHLSYDRNVKSFIHELNHISSGDYDSYYCANCIEMQSKA